MMRPAEVAALTRDGCHLPEHGWGRLTFTDSSTAAGKAVTDDGQVHEHRGLKGRTKGRPPSGRRARKPARQVPSRRNWSPCCAVTSSGTALARTGAFPQREAGTRSSHRRGGGSGRRPACSA